MSRAYRIRVSESLNDVLRAEDHVSTQLEILQILPTDAMAELLSAELQKQGFQEEDGQLVRTSDGVRITVDPKTGIATVHAEDSENVSLQASGSETHYDDFGPSGRKVKKELKEQLKNQLQQEASERARELQKKVTDQLESQLCDLRQELDQAVNQATAAALKQKAAQLGQIKELTEDPNSGSLTIVVEV